ncbi:hypothetical protein [Streptococcus merionis]|uniref:hypothetical protein n=1 Tax=Streptococcus merionis TaxID=400065 RepID=UPI0035115B0F
MEKFLVKLAGLVIQVSCQFLTTKYLCQDYLTTELPFDFEVTVTLADLNFEKQRATLPFESVSEEYLEELALYRLICEQLPSYNRFLFHGSCLVKDDQAYLFTGPSGTGKSTHTRLWKEYFGEDTVRILNDDKPLIHVDKEQIIVYGTPWDGKHHYSYNGHSRLSGICFLHQAEEVAIARLSQKDSFGYLMGQTYHPLLSEQKVIQALALVEQVSRRVETYSMDCDISFEAVICAYTHMKKEK